MIKICRVIPVFFLLFCCACNQRSSEGSAISHEKLYETMVNVVVEELNVPNSIRNGDLLFQTSSKGNLSGAVEAATQTDSGVTFTHVGIYAVMNCQPMVIEANPDKGVVATTLRDFLGSPTDGVVTLVRRVNKDNVDCDAAVERAKKCIGKPYDWEFAADNDKLYCSELVQTCYLQSNGMPMFESAPMNFQDANGNILEYWAKTFDAQGLPVPQGAPGTNPNAMFHSPMLTTVE